MSDNNPDATQIGMALVIALVFASSPVALAHDTAWPRAVTSTGATVVDQQTDGFDVSRTAWPAPVGHRQPRAEDIPAEGPKNAMLICNSNPPPSSRPFIQWVVNDCKRVEWRAN